MWLRGELDRAGSSGLGDDARGIAHELALALAQSGEAPAAMVVHRVMGTGSPEPILDALYLRYGRRGARGRARLLHYMPSWELEGQVPRTADRAWVIALAYVEAAIAQPNDPDRSSRARGFPLRLPTALPAMKELLVGVLELGLQSRTSIKLLQKLDTSKDARALATDLRAEARRVRNILDRWSNQYLRDTELEFLDQVEATLQALIDAPSIQQLEQIERPTIKKKKLRSMVRKRARVKGHRVPTTGTRYGNFQSTLQGYVNDLDRIFQHRLLELSDASLLGPLRDQVRVGLDQLGEHHRLVAEALLEGAPPPEEDSAPGTSTWWDPEWFREAGLLLGLALPESHGRLEGHPFTRQLMERAVTVVDPDASRMIQAYYAAERADREAVVTALHGQTDPFLLELLAHCEQQLLGDAAFALEMAQDYRDGWKRRGLATPALDELVATLDDLVSSGRASAYHGFGALEEIERLESQLQDQWEALRTEAHQLHDQVKRLRTPRSGALQARVRTCRLVGEAALQERYAQAVEAFRLVVECTRDPEDREVLERLERFFSQAGLE